MKQTGRFSWFRGQSIDIETIISETIIGETITGAVPPVAPDPCFRSDLKQRLLAAHPEMTERRSLWRTITADPLRIWSMAATLPVILGIIAFLWRRSQRTVEQPA